MIAAAAPLCGHSLTCTNKPKITNYSCRISASLVRQYSLCGSPTATGTWRIAVLRDSQSRGGSDFVHDKLHVGSSVRVRGPRNHFPLVSAPRYQFIAGGIGITPMLPMIEAVEAAGAQWHL